MKNVLIIETLSEINGGQKMSLLISDILEENGNYNVIWAIPEFGILSKQIENKGLKYEYLGNLSLPAGKKGIYVIPRYLFMTISTIYKIYKIIKKYKINIIYSPGPASLPWSAICGILTNKPVVWHLHHIFIDSLTKRLINFCSKLKSVKYIISVSNEVKKQINNDNVKNKLKVIYNPVDYNKFNSGNIENLKNNIIYELSKQKDVKILEHIGIIHPSKKQDLTIKIIAGSLNNSIKLHAVFIGECSKNEKEYKNNLVELSNNLGISEQIHFVGYQKNIEDWLKIANIIFIPSVEGLSLVALEAMAACVPIVATSEFGVGELIRISKSGYMYNNNSSIYDINTLINKAMNDKDIIMNGKLFAMNNDYKNYKKEIINVFESL